MHIAFCADRNYLPWCSVPAKTAVEKSIDCDSISIHFILTSDCKESPYLNILVHSLESSRVSIYTYFVDQSDYPSLPVSGHASNANYFRLLIPELLPLEIDKIIYLDCDILVLDSLLPLWDTDLRGSPLAAVSNMSLFEAEARRLGLPYLNGTFNSGVLVINLGLFRREKLHSACIQKAQEMGNDIVYWDQDVLNIATSGRWLKLDNGWNVQHGYYLDPLIQEKYAVSDPKIIHFTGNNLKPWQSKILPYSDVYMRGAGDLGAHSDKLDLASLAACQINRAITSIKQLTKMGLESSFLSPRVIAAWKPVYQYVINKAAEALSISESEKTRRAIQANQQDLIQCHFSSLSVASGPFRGMKYPTAKAVGSALLPKLAGSYEIEISQLLTPELLAGFTSFIDIGCAEGYYAVGAATMAPHLTVYAYDTNADARRLCRAMAELNNVSNRVQVGKRFSLYKFAELKAEKVMGTCLVLLDCEGAEASIFSSESYQYVHLLSDATIIVETHDFIRPGTADHVIQFFSGTHHVERVLAVGDLLRPSYYPTFAPVECDYDTKLTILAENRPGPMEWLIFRPLDDA